MNADRGSEEHLAYSANEVRQAARLSEDVRLAQHAAGSMSALPKGILNPQDLGVDKAVPEVTAHG